MIDRETWYSERDSRTKLLVDGFENFSVGVIVSPESISSYAVQVMTLVALNILARWCRNIRIQIPESISCLPFSSGQSLISVIKKIISGVDPFGNFIFEGVKENSCDLILIIGKSKNTIRRPFVWIDGAGWLAGVSFSKINSLNQPYDNNPIGPSFAASLGIAEIFRCAVGQDTPAYEAYYSLFDFNYGNDSIEVKNNSHSFDYKDNIDFGTIHQVGCGAVGSSLDFLFSLIRAKAKLFLIDFDEIDITNCNRSLVFTADDIDPDKEPKKKNVACEVLLRNSEMNPIIFEGSYADFIAKNLYLNNAPDIILCLANEQNVWSDIQNNYPPLVFHATTTKNWGLNFGRHIPLKEWCILCRFGKEIETKFIPECSQSEIQLSESKTKPIEGVLPFLSPTAAVTVFSEMIKLSLKDYPVNENFILFSMKSPNTSFQKIQRNKERECMCNSQISGYYPEQIKQTKFWRLAQ